MPQDLTRRFIGYGCNYYDDNGDCNDNWYNWGRWVLLGVLIAAAILLFFFFSCLSARRRRRMGYAPYRGTGWVTGNRYNTNAGNAPPPENYYAQQQQQQPYYPPNTNNASYNPPPAYGANNTSGYYGKPNNYELQQPQQVYQYGRQ